MEETFDPIDNSLSDDLPILYRVLRKVDEMKLQKVVILESKFHQTKHWVSTNYYKPISQMISKNEK
jgi:hypothetical protein